IWSHPLQLCSSPGPSVHASLLRSLCHGAIIGAGRFFHSVDFCMKEASKMRQSRGILFAWTIVIALSEATDPTINWAAGPSRPAEMQKRDQWLKDRLLSTASMVAEQGSPAFSFVYGER